VKVPTSGDRSLQTYGRPADPAEFAKIAATVRSYDLAVAAGNGAAACELLAPSVTAALVNTFGRGRLPCPQLLDRLFAGYPSFLRHQLRAVRVTDARVNSQGGFVFFTMPGTPSGFIRILNVSGAWKVGAIAGSSIP
jgi:hypothetical protein